MRDRAIGLMLLAAACQKGGGSPPADSVMPASGKMNSFPESTATPLAVDSAASPSKAEPRRSAKQMDDSPDSLVGVVAVSGSVPGTMVTFRPSGGGRALLLTGPEATALGNISGAEVWVKGSRADVRRLQVARFGVLSVDGVAAVDGTLTRDGANYVLVTAEGRRHPIAKLPSALRDKVGARVWLSGPLDRDPNAFGLISEKP